jgi:chromosome segregation ATPase
LALKAKTEELDDMTFSFESERKSKTKGPVQVNGSCVNNDEMQLLVVKLEDAEKKLSNAQNALAIKSTALDDVVRMYECEKERMLEEIQYLRDRSNELEATASKSCESDYELQNVKEENSALKSEISFLKRQVVLANKGSDEVCLLRMQLKSAKQTIDECDIELKQKNDAVKYAETRSHELRAKMERYEQRAKDAEKANAALTMRDKELRDSVSRVRELVENLASENANLKEKISDYKRKLAERDTRSRELDNLFKSAMNERDAAVSEAKMSKASLHKLKESTDQLQHQFEKLNKERNNADRERETMCLRLDKMAGTSMLVQTKRLVG